MAARGADGGSGGAQDRRSPPAGVVAPGSATGARDTVPGRPCGVLVHDRGALIADESAGERDEHREAGPEPVGDGVEDGLGRSDRDDDDDDQADLPDGGEVVDVDGVPPGGGHAEAGHGAEGGLQRDQGAEHRKPCGVPSGAPDACYAEDRRQSADRRDMAQMAAGDNVGHDGRDDREGGRDDDGPLARSGPGTPAPAHRAAPLRGRDAPTGAVVTRARSMATNITNRSRRPAQGPVLRRAASLPTTTLGTMSRSVDRHPEGRYSSLRRPVAVSALATLFAVGAHLAAGGTVVATADVMLVAAVLAGASTWLTREVGRRTRGMVAAAAVVGAGQGGIELMLGSTGQAVRDPLLAAALHAGASLVLMALALGVERVAADLHAGADRTLPSVCWSCGPDLATSAARIGDVDSGDRAEARWWPERCPVRGPPLPL